MNATVSERILLCMAYGKTLPEAIDQVLGTGAYQGVMGYVYDLSREVR